SGRYVRIELPGHDQILSLAEVQVFNGSTNVARRGKARQSSTDFNAPAKLAIDGNTNGEFTKARSTTHTKKSDDPWWEVDLGKSLQVDKIVVWNRTDNGLEERLSHFVVKVLDEAHQPVWQTKIGPAPRPSLALSPSNTGDVILANATDSLHQTSGGDWSAARAIEGAPGSASGWSVGPELGQPHTAVFETATDIGDGGTTLVFTLDQQTAGSAIRHFRISATTDPRPVKAESEILRRALAVAPANRSAAERSAAFAEFLASADEPRAVRAQIDKLTVDLKNIKPPMTAIMRELPPGKRREDHVLIKGNFLAKGPIVQPDVPAAFGALPKGAPHNRLGLAEWI